MTQTVLIDIQGQDRFSGVSAQAADAVNKLGHAVSSFPSAANAGISAAGGLASSIGNMATVAGGIVAAQVFNRIAEGISSFVSTGLSAVGSAQKLESSLRSLLTANNMYEQSTETVTVATTKELMSQDELQQKLEDLNATLGVQKATYQEQEEKIRQMAAAWGEDALNVGKERAAHIKLANDIEDTQLAMASLTTSETKYEEATKTSWGQVMSMADAQRIARKETDQLMHSISEMAVVSPFETQSVELVAKYAVAAGMGVKQTEAFTAGFLDMAASVGIGSEDLGFAADQLLQVKKVGKLTEIDLRQLRRMGIDVSKVLGVEMGMSVDEFNQKASTTPAIFDDLFSAMTKFSQNTFAGTSKEMALSVKGIQSTVNDIFVIGARSFFRPLVEAVSPAMGAFVGKISDFVLGGSMDTIGKNIAETIMAGFAKFKKFGAGGLFASLGFEGGALFFKKVSKLMELLTGDTSTLTDAIRKGLGGAFDWLQSNLFPLLSQGIQLVIDGVKGFQTNVLPIITTVIGKLETFTKVFRGLGVEGGLQVVGQMIATELTKWGAMFIDWIAPAYAAIPGALTSLVQGIATFLTDNWPTISAALTEWSTKIWGWVQVAAGAAAGALAALGVAMLAWATSGEAQTAMNELGTNLGRMITDYITLQFQAGGGASTSLFALAAGLLAAVAGIAGSLIILGGQLVAGILSGILKSLKIDLKPAMFNELGGILSGLSDNWAIICNEVGRRVILGFLQGFNEVVGTVNDFFRDHASAWTDIVTETDWAALGEAILDGVLAGLKNNAAKVLEYLKDLLGRDAINSVMTAIGAHSPADAYIPIGQSIIDGLLYAPLNSATAMQDALNRMLDLKSVRTDFGAAMGMAGDDLEKWMDTFMNPDKVEFALTAFKNAIRNNLEFATSATDEQLQDLLEHAVGNWEKAGIQDAAGAAERFIDLIRGAQASIQADVQATAAENFQKMLGGVGQFASAATQQADTLNQKITVLNSLLRQGGDAFNVEGQIMSAAQAQARLNQLVAEQAGMQGDLAGITGFQAGLANMQEQQGLLGQLSAPVNAAAGDIVGGLSQLMGFLGQQIMAGLGQQLQIPAMAGGGGTGAGGTGGGVVGGGTVNQISFAPVINTTANEQSIIQLFYTLMSQIPGGT